MNSLRSMNDNSNLNTEPYGCEVEVSALCPAGWAHYTDFTGSEGRDSCVKLSGSTVGSWSSAMAACPPGSHALSIGSSNRTYGLLAFATSLAAQSSYSIYYGCSQAPGSSQRSRGWSWVDGTPAGNLNCGNGSGGDGCGIWAPQQPE